MLMFYDVVRFYYADERNAEGAPVLRERNGEAHAMEYLTLAQREDQGPWLWTFVKGKGYVDFGGK